MIRAALLAGALALAAAAMATPALAEADLFSRDTFSGLVDLRLAAAQGEKSWTDGAYGKTRYSGAGDGQGWRVTPQVAEAALEWKPRFTWDLGAVIHAQAAPDQAHVVDLAEAYLTYRPVPTGPWRFAARLGYFYPPVSMEHDDPAWGVTHTITPSAINSWIGEEVKVVGAEMKITRKLGDQELAVTGAVFDDDDTSGTLLALRGWALHDQQGTLFGDFPLPKLDPDHSAIWRGQSLDTDNNARLDKRIGAYGRLDWQTGGPLSLNLFYYDNMGNKTSKAQGQWSWQTEFWNLGASYDVDAKTRILAQALTGRTLEGFPTPIGIWIDVDFSSAYLLATHSYGKAAVTARVEWFETRDHTYVVRDDNNEHGWAATAAWRYDFNPRLTLLTEAMHVTSWRPARLYRSDRPHQDQTVLQTSLRVRF